MFDFPKPFKHKHPPIKNVHAVFETQSTLGQRAADKVAAVAGSWPFIIVQSTLLVAWVALNVTAFVRHWDPYPFILMNLVLSLQAAYTAPVIMMSQNRQESKDRLRSEHDFKINLKAELEIRHLNEKLDHLINHQWQNLLETQQVQLEMLDEMMSRESKTVPENDMIRNS